MGQPNPWTTLSSCVQCSVCVNDPLFVRGRRFITYGTTEKGGCSVWALETILTVQQDPNAGNSRIAVISKKKKKKKKKKVAGV